MLIFAIRDSLKNEKCTYQEKNIRKRQFYNFKKNSTSYSVYFTPTSFKNKNMRKEVKIYLKVKVKEEKFVKC